MIKRFTRLLLAWNMFLVVSCDEVVVVKNIFNIFRIFLVIMPCHEVSVVAKVVFVAS